MPPCIPNRLPIVRDGSAGKEDVVDEILYIGNILPRHFVVLLLAFWGRAFMMWFESLLFVGTEFNRPQTHP